MAAEPGAMGGAMQHGLATPWAHFFAAIILGAWLITSPSALGYGSAALAWSDGISGALIIAFATITLVRRSAWAPWASSLVGVWLLFAPLVFWAPSAVAYANDTLAGALVIAFVLLMPGMPGMRMLPGPDVPPGVRVSSLRCVCSGGPGTPGRGFAPDAHDHSRARAPALRHARRHRQGLGR